MSTITYRVGEPAPRPTDPKDYLNISHIIEAGALMVLGHPLLHVERDRRNSRSIYVFNRDAQDDLARLRRAVEEVAAIRERTFNRRTTLNGGPTSASPQR